MCFTDLDTVKKVLRIPLAVTKDDDAIQCAVDAANAEILAWFCLTDCAPTTYNVSADLDCSGRLPNVGIGPYPVISLTTVKLGGVVLASSDYVLRGFSVVRFCDSCARRASGCKAFEAEVVAGFDPADPYLPQLQYGVAKLAALMYQSGATGDVKSEQIGRHRITRFTPSELAGTFGADGWPPELSRALSKYARPLYMTRAEVSP